MKNIAVIGAGISGLSYANLSKNNCTIFEKNSYPGGRVVTKKINKYSFDFGAQFFIARDLEFLKFITPMLKQKIILPWRARFAEIVGDKVVSQRVWEEGHFVGSPNMNVIGEYLANDLNVYYNCKIVSLEKESNKWLLIDQAGKSYGVFDWVVFAVPPVCLFKVLRGVLCDFSHIKMDACYSLMLGFLESFDLDFDAALIKNKDISWISVNSSKPNRQDNTCLLIHSTNKWANNNRLDKNLVIDYLMGQVSSSIDIDLSLVHFKDIHFWHSANIVKQNKEKYVIDWQNKLAFCGDWFIHGRVESAFLSAYHLINRLNVI
jgi:predicted NAD/FAD-dependent oxidoreductase